MVIRPMSLGDLDQVLALEGLSFTSPWERKSFENELVLNQLAHYYVADQVGEILGYAGFWQVMDEGHITNVAVHPNHRKLGVGKALIDHLIHQAKTMTIDHMTLEVRVSNAAAIVLYQQFGFVSHGIRPKYYQDTDEDALIMWAKIGEDL